MTGTEGEIVYTRDLSSGKVHKRVRVGAVLMSAEGDNLAESGAYDILEDLDLVEHDQLCERCWPEPSA